MIALADNALTTLERIRLTGLSNGEGELADGQLTMLINQASAYIDAALQRKLRRQAYTEHITPSGSQQLLLGQWPVLEVTQLTQDGAEIPATAYSIEDGGILYKDDGWRWSGYPRGLAYDPWAARRDIRVSYTAGYVLPKDATEEEPCTLPADLEGLCMEMVQSAWGKLQTGGNAGLKSFGISDVRWEWVTEMPQTWEYTLNQYRRWL